MTHRRPLRAAIIGAGLTGGWHAAAIRRLGGVVSAVVDPMEERAGRLAARCGAQPTRLVDVVRDRLADVVHVCTPVDSHGEIASAVLHGGVPAIIEKPLTEDAESTARLLHTAEQRNILLCPVHQFPFQRGFRRVLATLRDWGPVLHAEYIACSAGADDRSDADRDRVALDILPHPLSLLERVFTIPLTESHWLSSRPGPGELRVIAHGGSVTASVLISLAGRPTRNTLTLVGKRGTAHVDLFHGFATIEAASTSRTQKVLRPFRHASSTMTTAAVNLALRAVRREPAYPGLRTLIADMYEAIRAGTPGPIGHSSILEIATVRDRLASQL